MEKNVHSALLGAMHIFSISETRKNTDKSHVFTILPEMNGQPLLIYKNNLVDNTSSFIVYSY